MSLDGSAEGGTATARVEAALNAAEGALPLSDLYVSSNPEAVKLAEARLQGYQERDEAIRKLIAVAEQARSYA